MKQKKKIFFFFTSFSFLHSVSFLYTSNPEMINRYTTVQLLMMHITLCNHKILLDCMRNLNQTVLRKESRSNLKFRFARRISEVGYAHRNGCLYPTKINEISSSWFWIRKTVFHFGTKTRGKLLIGSYFLHFGTRTKGKLKASSYFLHFGTRTKGKLSVGSYFF